MIDDLPVGAPSSVTFAIRAGSGGPSHTAPSIAADSYVDAIGIHRWRADPELPASTTFRLRVCARSRRKPTRFSRRCDLRNGARVPPCRECQQSSECGLSPRKAPPVKAVASVPLTAAKKWARASLQRDHVKLQLAKEHARSLAWDRFRCASSTDDCQDGLKEWK